MGKIDKNIIPIIIGCVFEIICSLLRKIGLFTFFNHIILTIIYASMFQIFAFIPFFILKFRMKKEKIDVNNFNSRINYIYTDNQKEITKHKYLYILLSSALFFIQGIMLFYTIELKVNYWVLDICIYCLINYLIFKIKLYRHHILSMIIIILTGLLIDLGLKNLQNDVMDHWSSVLIRLLREIIYSVNIVIHKYIMDKKFCSAYELTGINGIFLIIISVIFSLINYYYLKLDNFDEYFSNLNTEKILMSLLYSFIELILFLSACFTIKNNTSCHVYLISICLTIANSFMDFSMRSIITIICLIFMLFISLIFYEIIEINCFGLSKNTKRNIMKRVKSEYSISSNSDDISENSENNNVLVQLETFL